MRFVSVGAIAGGVGAAVGAVVLVVIIAVVVTKVKKKRCRKDRRGLFLAWRIRKHYFSFSMS